MISYVSVWYDSVMGQYFKERQAKMEEAYALESAKFDAKLSRMMYPSYAKYIVEMWKPKGLTENQVLELMAIESETFK